MILMWRCPKKGSTPNYPPFSLGFSIKPIPPRLHLQKRQGVAAAHVHRDASGAVDLHHGAHH